jgi:hypothetical protein
LALDLHSVGSLPLEEQNVQNSQVAERRSGFYVSGRLDAEHIAELETLIAAETKGRRIILDLKDMTLTGHEGIGFLCRCEVAGIALVNCDAYVREWIAREESGK